MLDHPERVGLLGAELIANRLRSGAGIRLALPTGRTPAAMYAALRAHAADGSLPTEAATVFQLDEYAGLPPSDARSFAATLDTQLRGLRFAAVHRLDGAAADLDAEAARHQARLDEAPLDLVVLGLGRDGHVAFDEPGSTLAQGARRVRLTETTRADAAAGFGGLEHVPTQALSTGLRTIAAARAVLVLVTGAAKAQALRAMLDEPAGPHCPASLLRAHPRLMVVADRAAAGRLRPRAGWASDHAIIVLGHREPGVSAEHRISAESQARLRRAAHLARRDPPRTVILTGWTSTDGLSEAEQMLGAWNDPDVPALIEVAGRNTAENASRCLPLVLATGAVRRVTVVTSAWHLRAPYFFGPYDRFGIAVDHRPCLRHGPWLRMLVTELQGAHHAVRQRREAMAAMRPPPEAR